MFRDADVSADPRQTACDQCNAEMQSKGMVSGKERAAARKTLDSRTGETKKDERRHRQKDQPL